MLPYLFYLIIYPLLLLSSAFLGRKAADRWKRKHLQWKPLGMENAIVGFYALLTSFTLVQSGNIARDREAMVHTAADDISEVLRIVLVYDSSLNVSVRNYFSDFYALVKGPVDASKEGVSSLLKRIDQRDDAFDAEMQLYVEAHPAEREKIATLLAKIDRMESIYYRFLHSYHRTMPKLILLILVFFSLLISFLMGFVEKFHGNHIYISTAIFVVVNIIILTVIHDLDNPSFGFLHPNLDEIREVMETFNII